MNLANVLKLLIEVRAKRTSPVDALEMIVHEFSVIERENTRLKSLCGENRS